MKIVYKSEFVELTVSKSRFISKLYKVNDFTEANTILEELKKIYYNANHICYAINLSNSARTSDDKEPHKTAGMPILEVLRKNNIENTMAVVIRYFGGIKLGAGGLIRSYSKATMNAINNSSFQEKKNLSHLKIKIAYDYLGKVLNYIRENSYKILNIEYNNFIEFDAYFNKTDKNIIDDLTNLTNGSAIIEILKDEEILVLI